MDKNKKDIIKYSLILLASIYLFNASTGRLMKKIVAEEPKNIDPYYNEQEIEELIDNYDASEFSSIRSFSDTIKDYFRVDLSSNDIEFLDSRYTDLYDVKRHLDELEKNLKQIDYNKFQFDINDSEIYKDAITSFEDELLFSNRELNPDFDFDYNYGEDYSYLIIDGEKYKVLDENLITYLKALENFYKNNIDENKNDEDYLKNLKIITNQLIRNFLVNYELIEYSDEKVCKAKITYAKVKKMNGESD